MMPGVVSEGGCTELLKSLYESNNMSQGALSGFTVRSWSLVYELKRIYMGVFPAPNPSTALSPRALGLQGPFGWAAEGRHSCSSSDRGGGGLTHVQQCDVREGEGEP